MQKPFYSNGVIRGSCEAAYADSIAQHSSLEEMMKINRDSCSLNITFHHKDYFSLIKTSMNASLKQYPNTISSNQKGHFWWAYTFLSLRIEYIHYIQNQSYEASLALFCTSIIQSLLISFEWITRLLKAIFALMQSSASTLKSQNK